MDEKRREIAQALAPMAVRDPIAVTKDRKIALSNITEMLRDSNKINMLSYLGCDEKYKDGLASDFEWFAEWERVLPLCFGSGVLALYEEERRLLGIPVETYSATREELFCLWRQGNSRLSELRKDEQMPCVYLSKFVSNFIKTKRGSEDGFDALCRQGREVLNSFENKEYHLIIDLSESAYVRPDPYHAGEAFLRMKNDEKCKNEDRLSVLAQLLISLRPSPACVLHLYSRDGASVPLRLIAYLRQRGLFGGEIRLGVFSHSCPEDWQEVAACGWANPELLLLPSDFGGGLGARLRSVFSAYPVGGLRFGGVLTDSPLPRAAHNLLKEALAQTLAEICPDVPSAVALAKRFFA